MSKVVFLYSTPQGGHKKCADSVREVLAHSTNIKTVGLDAIGYLYPFLGSVIEKTYIEVLKYTPQIWDYLYDNQDISEITRELREFFSFLETPKLKALLTKFKPDAFVCTHAVPCILIAEQKRRGKCNLPLVAIITDYDVHSYWTHPQVDLYLVANEKSRKTLIKKGIKAHKIKISGIPVAPAFSKTQLKAAAKKTLGIKPSSPVILLMGGMRGLGPIPKITENLLSLKSSPEVLVVTGNNQSLKSEMTRLNKSGKLHLYGLTHQIPLLMDAADLLITKPGGMTCSEALVKGLPMILVKPLPGQEERNSKFLLENSAAFESKSLKDLTVKVEKFLKHPRETRNLSKKMLKIAMPRAAWIAAQEIKNLLD